MKLIRSIMGRRQFLIAAGMTSTAALACRKLVSFLDPVFQTSIAMASEKTGAVGMEGETNRYPHLLSPLRVRNRVLKNRIMHTPGTAGQVSGPERYPNDHTRLVYSELAKNAAIVTVREEWGEGAARWEDIPSVQRYVDQLIEDIHCEGSLACSGRLGGGTPAEKTIPNKEDFVTQAKQYEDAGYDVVEVGERQMKTIEDARSIIEGLEAVRKTTNILILLVLIPYTPGKSRGAPAYPGSPGGPPNTGPEMEEFVAMAKELEGLADIIRFKDSGHATNHPNCFILEKGKPWMLPFAEAIKESGNKIIVCPTGGFSDPALNDEWIGSGKCDMVGMNTSLYADPDWVKKAYEGRAEDIVPCVKCFDCIGRSRTVGPRFLACTVNPTRGLTETKKGSIRPPTAKRKVAVIGGGPGGMKAAITAAERGHKVTLYEKGGSLGGLLQHTDFAPYKWAYKDFKDYLVRQTYKAGVEVQLKTTATPETIKAKGYDTVLVALGAEPIIPRIPGADGKNVYNIVDSYINKKALGKNVVLIGGGVFGTETGIGLALEGYKVTLLTTGKEMPWALMPEESVGSHNKEIQLDIALNNPNFSYILDTTATRISEGKVIYKDSTGSEKSIQGDSIIIWAGLKPRIDEAMKFSVSAGQVFLVGDCTGDNGTIMKTMRSAFFMASQV